MHEDCGVLTRKLTRVDCDRLAVLQIVLTIMQPGAGEWAIHAKLALRRHALSLIRSRIIVLESYDFNALYRLHY